MAIDFPNAPTNGDTYVAGGKTWVYSSSTQSWTVLVAYTANRALQSNGSGEVSASSVTSTELGYLSGVTSAVQTQLGAKLDAANPAGTGTLTLAGAGNAGIELGRTDGTSSTPYIDFHSSATANDYNVRLIASGGTGTVGSGTLTVTAATVALPANTSIGTVSATEIGYVDGVTSGIQSQLNGKASTTHASTHAAGGTDPVTLAQSQVTNLTTDLAGKQATITGAATTITSSNLTASRALASDASGKVAVSAVTSTELGYLSGVTSALQTQLGGKASTTHASTHASAGSDPITIAQSQVTNLTTDLAAKAPLASPTFTGTPAAPTATAGTNSTQIATTAFVATGLSGKANTSHTHNQSELVTTVSDKAASYTIVAGDKNSVIRSTAGTGITITIANVLAVGERIDFIQDGAGQITFAAGSGVTLLSKASNLKTSAQYAGATVLCVASGQYRLVGDIAA